MGTPTPDLIGPPGPDVSPRRKAVSRPGAFRFSAVELLVAIALLFLATPFVEDLPRGDLLEVALMSVVMVSAVLAVGGQRRTLIVAIVLLVPALAAKWGNHVWPDVFPSEIFLVSGMVFFMFVIARLLSFILRAPRVDANVLCAGISVYLMLGLLWILPLFPAQPKLGPVLHEVTQLIPSGFPLLVMAPALVLDWLWPRMVAWKMWKQALVSGALFLAVLLPVQWPFADFLQSPGARNAVFGSAYYDYNVSPQSYAATYRFVPLETAAEFRAGLGIALACAVVSTWLGLGAGEWLRRVRR